MTTIIDRSVINLGAGAPDLDTPPVVKLAAIRAILDNRTRYTDSQGLPELRQAIARKLQRDNGIPADPADVFAAAGGKFALYCLLRAVLRPGDEVIVPSPHYAAYPGLVTLAGGVPVLVPTDRTAGHRLDPSALRRALSPRTAAVMFNSPANPTGVVYSASELAGLTTVVMEHSRAWIISDELYEHFVFDENTHCSPATLGPAIAARTLTVNGVSKAYGMTGWRIGYAHGPHEVIRQACAIQKDTLNCPSSIGQWAAVAALDGPSAGLLEQVASIGARRRTTVDFLNANTDLDVRMPQGSIYLLADARRVLGGPNAGTVDDISSSLEAHGVRVGSGTKFGSPTGMRITFSLHEPQLLEGLQRLAVALRTLPFRP